MIVRLGLLLMLACATPAWAQTTLDARIEQARHDLARMGPEDPEYLDTVMQRQLLTSLERRRDLQQSRADAERILAAPLPVQSTPRTLLQRDDVRRQLQELDSAERGEARRMELLTLERDSAAARLANRVAAYRGLRESGAPEPQQQTARLDMQLSESVVAELDLLGGVLALQRQDAARRQLDLRRLLDRAVAVAPGARDEAEIDARMQARQRGLQQRLQQAHGEREQAYQHWQAQAAEARAPGRLAAERLANANMELDLTREALTTLAIEQAAWQLALRLHTRADAQALVDARDQGPRLLQRLQRRREFMTVSAAQVMDRIGALDAAPASLNADERSERGALREVLELRLRRLQAAERDEQSAEALLERLRADFEARLGTANWREKLVLHAAAARAWLRQVWNFELFTVQQSVDVDGRKTDIARGVTVGKVVKAPLLLLVGVWLSVHITRWFERRARKRGVDEARARLVRRWTLGTLACLWALLSLVLAGIPLAAFAFAGGAIAIGVGFGTQNLFKNLISGILVLLERPFRLGDVIEVGQLRGTVVDIDLRTSVVRDSEGAETLIPNSTLVEQSVRNLTFHSRALRHAISVDLDPATDPRQAMDVLRAVLERHGQLLDAPTPSVQLSAISGDAMTFALQYWLEFRPGNEAQRIASDLRLMVLGALEDHGLKLSRSADVASWLREAQHAASVPPSPTGDNEPC